MQAATFMEKNFKGSIVTATKNFCPKCLLGGNAEFFAIDGVKSSLSSQLPVKTISWKELYDQNILDPYQSISAFKQTEHGPIFERFIDVKSPGPECCKMTCFTKCFLCLTEINDDGVKPEHYALHAHATCCKACDVPNCKKLLPTTPAFFSASRGPPKCEEHSKATGDVLAVSLKRSHSILRDTQPYKKEPEVKTRPEIKRVNVPKKKAKTVTFNLDKSSHEITKFLAGGRELEEKEAEKKEAEKKPDAPKKGREFMHKDRKAYAKDNKAYDAETDELLFTFKSASPEPVRNKKLDFTPPSEGSRHPNDVDMRISDLEMTGA